MKRILSMILALAMMLCACAFAETEAVEAAPITEEQLIGLWNLEYITAEGYMITAEGYGMVVTLTIHEDGSAEMDFDGEIMEGMGWYIEEGKAFITGYNPEEDVEILISEYGVLEITDEYGSMFFTRPAEETEE